MLAAIALSPSAPVLVPELAGAAAAEVADVRDAAVAAATALPDRWVVVGVGPAAAQIAPETRGTFAGYGAEVAVALSDAAPDTVSALPLCALWAGWLRQHAAPAAQVAVRVFPADLDAAAALAEGRALRAELDAESADVGVLVVADGASTLSASAPGGDDPDAPARQDALDDALGAGDAAVLVDLCDGAVGRVAYLVLAGLAGPGRWTAHTLYRGAPYGVGYFVGTWTP